MATLVDFETFYASGKQKYSVRTMHPEQYCADERFHPYVLSVCDGTHAWAGEPKDFNWSALDGQELVSHNAGFDHTVYKEMAKRGLAPKLNIPAWHCTANMTAYLCNRRALDKVVAYLFKTKLEKQTRADANNKHWPDGFTPQQRAEMIEYAKADALWGHRLWAEHSDRWPAAERQLSDLTIRQTMRGVQINTDLLTEYLMQSHEARAACEKVIPWIKDSEDESWDDFNTKPTSTKCIAEQCRRVGIPCAPIKSDDEEAYLAWATQHAKQHPWIHALEAWRSINKLYQTFVRMKQRLRADGTMPFGLLYFGAHCMPGDTEVLTEAGWQPLDTWVAGNIAQWSPDGSIVFEHATNNAFFIEEPLLKIDAPYVNGSFTLGHTMPVLSHGTFNFHTCQAGDFAKNKQRYVPIAGRLSQNGRITAEQMRLLVAAQADGHWETKEYKGGLQFTFRKARKIKRLKELLSASHIPYHEYFYGPSYGGQVSIRIYRADCPEWLCPDRKIFGSWLLDSTPEARQAFAEELMLWDAHAPTSEYYSSVKANVEWAATLLHLSGYAMAVREKPNQKGNRKRHWAGVLRKTSRALVCNLTHTTRTPATAQTVFCPTTRTGFWVFRSQGKIGITGNTGRWSGAAQINFQNMRKLPVLIKQDGFVELEDGPIFAAVTEKDKTGKYPSWVRYAIDFRALIVPRPGKKMILSDLAQIEPRVLAHLSGNHELLQQMAGGMSIYEAYNRTAFGYTGPKMSKASPEYGLVKIQVLQLGYQAGWEKFIVTAMKESGIDLTKDDPEFIIETDPFTDEERQVPGYGALAKKIVREFREKNPKITALWKRLDEQFKSSVGDDFVMSLPSGRKMTYEHVKCEARIVQGKDGKPQRKCEFTAGVGDKRRACYGGKLTENLVQAVARDVFGTHLTAMDSAGLDILFTSHDEAILEVDQSVTTKDIERFMSVTPEWLPGCPIAAEAKEALHYLK